MSDYRRPGDEGMTIESPNVYTCYCVARDEADRYQMLANAQDQGTAAGRQKRAILLAKRNAASRIARIVRYGKTSVEASNGRQKEE
jgi:hypothetical protein